MKTRFVTQASVFALAFSLLQEPAQAVLHFNASDLRPAEACRDTLSAIEGQAIAAPMDWMQIAWARSSAFLLRRQVWTTVSGTVSFVALDYTWTHLTKTWSQIGLWHLLITQQVTGLISGSVANILIQKMDLEAARRPFRFGFLGIQLAGAVSFFSLVEGFLWFGHVMPMIPAVGPVPAFWVRALIQVFVVFPFVFNPINAYAVARLWQGKNHAQATQAIREILPHFSRVTTGVELGIAAFAFWLGSPMLTYFVVSAWDIAYLLVLNRVIDQRVTRAPEGPFSRWMRRLFNSPLWGPYVPISAAILWSGSIATLLHHGPPLLFWSGVFPMIGLLSWSWTRFVRWRMNRAADRLRLYVEEVRYFKELGESPMSLVVRLRIPLEREHRSLVFWLNRLAKRDRIGIYERTIRAVLGPGSEKIPSAALLNPEFPRLVGDLLEFCKTGAASERLVSLMAVHLEPATSWEEVFEDRRTGILERSRFWRGPGQFWPEPSLQPRPPVRAPQPSSILLRDRAGGEASLAVTPLVDEDRRELNHWTRSWPVYEVDDDLEHFLLTGLKPGEYGYKLVQREGETEIIQGFVLLFNTDGHLHLHIIYSSPLSTTLSPIIGMGRALTQLAFRDAVEQGVPLTTFPTTPDAVRLFEGMEFKQLAINGTEIGDMWAIDPEAMRDQLENSDTPSAYLPAAGSFLHVPVYQKEQSATLPLHGISYRTTNRVLISRRLWKRYAMEPDKLWSIIQSNLPGYFDRERAEHGKVAFILDEAPEAAPARSNTAIMTSKEYQKSSFRQRVLSAAPPFSARPPHPPQRVHYRQATPEDLDNLLNFRERYYARRTYQGIPATPEALLRLILTGEWAGDVYVAETEQGVVGYAMAYSNAEAHYAEIEEGMVIPSLQPYDVGDRLLEKCRDAAVKRLSNSSTLSPQPIILVQEQSELTLIAKVARRIDFVRYEAVPNLWVYGKTPKGSQTHANGFGRRLKFGFTAGDPRSFPKAIVPKLLRAARDYRNPRDREKQIKIFKYIRKYRWWDLRLWWAWGGFELRRARPRALAAVLAVVSVFTAGVKTTATAKAATPDKKTFSFDRQALAAASSWAGAGGFGRHSTRKIQAIQWAAQLEKHLQPHLKRPLSPVNRNWLTAFLGNPTPREANTLAILQWLGRRTLPALAYHHLIISTRRAEHEELDLHNFRKKSFGKKQARHEMLEAWLGEPARTLLKDVRDRALLGALQRPQDLDDLLLGMLIFDEDSSAAQDLVATYMQRLKKETKVEKRPWKNRMGSLPSALQKILNNYLPAEPDLPDLPSDAIFGDVVLDFLVARELIRQLGFDQPVTCYRQILKLVVKNDTIKRFMTRIPGWPRKKFRRRVTGQYFEMAAARVFMEHGGLVEEGQGLPKTDQFAREQYAREFAGKGAISPSLTKVIKEIVKGHKGVLDLSGLAEDDWDKVLRAFARGWLHKSSLPAPRARRTGQRFLRTDG